MNSVMYPVFVLFVFSCGLTTGNDEPSFQSENKWDPSHEFFQYDPEAKKDPIHSGIDVLQYKRNEISDKSIKQYYNNQENLRYRAYLSRFINIFLSNSGFSDDAFEGVDGKTVTVDLTLSKKDFATLKKFTSGKDISLETLDNCFSSIFNTSIKFPIKTSVFMNYLKYAILIALLFAILAYIVFMLGKINFKVSRMRFVLFTAYISIVLHGLLKEYEDRSEDLMLKRIEFEHLVTPPKECMFSHMTFMDKMLFHIFRDKTCERFLQSRKSVFYEMDFVSAFIKPFKSIFLMICSSFGEGSEKIIKPLIDRSPWPINILLEVVSTVLYLPLFFIGFFVMFCLFTSRNISLGIPFFFSMAAVKNHTIKDDSSREKFKEDRSRSSKGSITNYVINKGGIVLLGEEDKQKFKSFNALGSSSSGFNAQAQSFQMLQQSLFMNKKDGNMEEAKSVGILSKQFATNKKEIKSRKDHKKYLYIKKTNFKPVKKDSTIKIAKENLDIVPVP